MGLGICLQNEVMQSGTTMRGALVSFWSASIGVFVVLLLFSSIPLFYGSWRNTCIFYFGGLMLAGDIWQKITSSGTGVWSLDIMKFHCLTCHRCWLFTSSNVLWKSITLELHFTHKNMREHTHTCTHTHTKQSSRMPTLQLVMPLLSSPVWVGSRGTQAAEYLNQTTNHTHTPGAWQICKRRRRQSCPESYISIQ